MSQKILVTYFSRPDENYNVGTVTVGNTALLAEKIIKDLAEQGITPEEFSITPVTPYPTDYQSCIAQASAELKDGVRPPFQGQPANLAEYSTIFLGYPIWWSDLPPVVYTFLEQYQSALAGKKLAPFCTHEGSGQSGTFAKLAELLLSAEVLPGFTCTGSTARTDASTPQVADWLESLNLA